MNIPYKGCHVAYHIVIVCFLLKHLTVWAYPKSAGEFKDGIVCCVKHNPEPVLFPISCCGVQPEIVLNMKNLDFGKCLLRR